MLAFRTQIGQIVLFELQMCKDYGRIAQKTDLAVRSKRSIVIGSSGVQCELLNTVSYQQFQYDTSTNGHYDGDISWKVLESMVTRYRRCYEISNEETVRPMKPVSVTYELESSEPDQTRKYYGKHTPPSFHCSRHSCVAGQI